MSRAWGGTLLLQALHRLLDEAQRQKDNTLHTARVDAPPRVGSAGPRLGWTHRGGSRREAAAGAGRRSWLSAPLVDEEAKAGGDVSASWESRFALAEPPRVTWAAVRPAPPLEGRLPEKLAAGLEEAWQRVCGSTREEAEKGHFGRGRKEVELRAFKACRAEWRRSEEARSAAADAWPRRWALGNRSGLLPHARGPLSLAWQRTLDSDLLAAGGAPRRAAAEGGIPPRRDGPGGAAWAAGDAGDEGLGLLPMHIACHWSIAKSGSVGGPLPHTLIFHATNSWDKEHALKSLGLWHFEASLARPPATCGRGGGGGGGCSGPEQLIWAKGGRPRVLAFAPPLSERRDARGLATPNSSVHATEVVAPLLLGALASGRLPALPRLPCGTGGPSPWLVWHGGFKTRSADQRYVQGLCRHGSCGIYWVATGSTDAAELEAADAAAREFGGGAGPFPRLYGRHPLSHEECKDGKKAWLLQPPAWEAYQELLGAAATPRATCAPAEGRACAATLHIDGVGGGGSGAAKEAPLVEYAALADALARADSAGVVYLPSRLRVREASIPRDVRMKLERYCSQIFDEGDAAAPAAAPQASTRAARERAQVGGVCPSSPPQRCRMGCRTTPVCPQGQCAMSQGGCCEMKCVSLLDGGHSGDAREVDERRSGPHRRDRESDSRQSL